MEEDVFRLDIAVDDVVFVHEIDGGADLPDEFPHQFLRHFAHFLQVLVEVLPQAGLQHKIGAVVVHEEVVKFDDVGVLQEALDFDFPQKLQLGGLIEGATVDRFDRVYHVVAVAPKSMFKYCAR